MLQHDEGGGAHQRPDERAEAAEDHHHQGLARHRPAQQPGRNVHDVLRRQRPGEPRDHARKAEHVRLHPPDRQAERAHPLFVVHHARQRPAESRAQDQHRRAIDGAEHGEAEQCEAAAVVQIDTDGRQVEPGDPAHAVVAAENRRLEDIGIGHLPEGQRRHDEVDAVAAGADRPDRPGGGTGDRHRACHGRGWRDAGLGRQDGIGIGADAHQRPVAKRDHAAETRHHVKREYEHGEDQDLGQDLDAEVFRCKRSEQRARGEQDERRIAKGVVTKHRIILSPGRGPPA